MGFLNKLLDYISGVNKQAKLQNDLKNFKRNYIFGSIISGDYYCEDSYNTKRVIDPHPTVLCLGCYTRQLIDGTTGYYVHGINLHALNNAELNWMIKLINTLKQNPNSTNPVLFYTYLKANAPSITAKAYRTYIYSNCDFGVVNPGFTGISEEYCEEPDDGRDSFLSYLNTKRPIMQQMQIKTAELRNNIINAINTIKVW